MFKLWEFCIFLSNFHFPLFLTRTEFSRTNSMWYQNNIVLMIFEKEHFKFYHLASCFLKDFGGSRLNPTTLMALSWQDGNIYQIFFGIYCCDLWIFWFNLLIWQTTLIDFQMLDQISVSGVNLTLSFFQFGSPERRLGHKVSPCVWQS